VTILESNVSKDYIILRKSSDTFSMDAGQAVISCPVSDTTVELESAKFYVESLDNSMGSYSNYISRVLDVYGKKDEKKEFFIGIISDDKSAGKMTAYYNPDDTPGSSRMTCLLRKYLTEKYPDMQIEDKGYDGTLNLDSGFEQSTEEYSHWIVISVGKDKDALAVSEKDMGEVMENAVKEYYGKK
jgi:hypothetical protein